MVSSKLVVKKASVLPETGFLQPKCFELEPSHRSTNRGGQVSYRQQKPEIVTALVSWIIVPTFPASPREILEAKHHMPSQEWNTVLRDQKECV